MTLKICACGRSMEYYASHCRECYEDLRCVPYSICRFCKKSYTPKARDRSTFCSRSCFFAEKKRLASMRMRATSRRFICFCSRCGCQFWSRCSSKKRCRNCKNLGRGFSTWCDKPIYVWLAKKCAFCDCIIDQKIQKQKPPSTCSPRCRRLLRREIEDRYDDGSPYIPQMIFERDNWICGFCRFPIDANYRFPHDLSATIDHIIPLSLGGPHLPNNVRAAHHYCNSVNGDKQSKRRLNFDDV